MKSLLITLGHSSSAMFVDGQTVIGYEQERLSRIKADSHFPSDAIAEIIKNVGLNEMKNCKIFISHWFNFVEGCMPNKYITANDLDNLKQISTDITFVNENFTHHDAHAYSALAFFKYHLGERKMENSSLHTIVADGFGNNGEVLSIYESSVTDIMKPRLVKRVYGYEKSLGLFYQYATSFVGMKENQDEYKFLGYESHIDEFDEDDINLQELNEIVANTAAEFFDSIIAEQQEQKPTLALDIESLARTKRRFYGVFKAVCTICNVADYNTFESRVIVGYFVQRVVETVLYKLIKYYSIHNVCLAGGCFYNVKLNRRILKSTDGLVSIMPLAGDQGAAIGMYTKFTNKQFPFFHLSFGKRDTYNYEKTFSNKENKNIFYRPCETDNDFNKVIEEIAKSIADNDIVDVVCGDMEFGPRALCNTSTFMLPSVFNTGFNNAMNLRNEVMPCAPVCTEENAKKLFFNHELERVVGSNHFMICTHSYKINYSKSVGGVMHHVPFSTSCTGRPQIARNGSIFSKVLQAVENMCGAKCLVNTSFNAHGNPIVFSAKDIMDNYTFQREHCSDVSRLKLFVVCAK